MAKYNYLILILTFVVIASGAGFVYLYMEDMNSESEIVEPAPPTDSEEDIDFSDSGSTLTDSGAEIPDETGMKNDPYLPTSNLRQISDTGTTLNKVGTKTPTPIQKVKLDLNR